MELSCSLGTVSSCQLFSISASSSEKKKKKKKTFAQALHTTTAIALSQLPRPSLKGDRVSIRISDDEYQKGLDSCKNNLHGRLLLPKGSQPFRVNDLRSKLLKLWKPLGQWRMIPLGRGFYEFSFASLEDLRSVWPVGSWNLLPGLLHLSQWSPDFKPSNPQQTHTICWVRLHELPHEYWRTKTLFEIAVGIGTPIAIDEATKNRVYGHFARILIDLDIVGMLLDELWVEREGVALCVNVEHEKLPPYCPHCRNIGHTLTKCRRKPTIENQPQKTATQVYVALPQLVEGPSGLSLNLQDNLQVQEVDAAKIVQNINNNVIGSDADNEEVVFEEPSPSHISDSPIPNGTQPIQINIRLTLQEKDNSTGLINQNAAHGNVTVSNIGTNLIHSPDHASSHGVDSEEDSNHNSLSTIPESIVPNEDSAHPPTAVNLLGSQHMEVSTSDTISGST